MLHKCARGALMLVGLASLLGLAAGCGGDRTSVYPETGGNVAAIENLPGAAKEVLRQVNRYRARNGRSSLSSDSSLNGAADVHSLAMASGTVPLGHHEFERRQEQMREQMDSITAMAENVGLINGQGMNNLQIAQEFVRLWSGSARHNANMLGDYMITGVGVARTGDGKIYVTQVFAKLGP
ncbi:MAG: CAP domain-containing protein [Verrucomicrobiota bacterium]